MTNLDSIFKTRDITLPTKVHLVKAMVFPVVMYGCERCDPSMAIGYVVERYFGDARDLNDVIRVFISPALSFVMHGKCPKRR